MEFELAYWHWLVFGMALMMIEIVLPSFTALWFGAGAILVGLLLLVFPDVPLGLQLFTWTLVSVLLPFLWFKYMRPLSVDRTKAGLSKEAIVGQSGQVIALPTSEQRGTLRFTTPILGAGEWSFICEAEVTLGDRVWVTDVAGNSLIVEKR